MLFNKKNFTINAIVILILVFTFWPSKQYLRAETPCSEVTGFKVEKTGDGGNTSNFKLSWDVPPAKSSVAGYEVIATCPCGDSNLSKTFYINNKNQLNYLVDNFTSGSDCTSFYPEGSKNNPYNVKKNCGECIFTIAAVCSEPKCGTLLNCDDNASLKCENGEAKNFILQPAGSSCPNSCSWACFDKVSGLSTQCNSANKIECASPPDNYFTDVEPLFNLCKKNNKLVKSGCVTDFKLSGTVYQWYCGNQACLSCKKAKCADFAVSYDDLKSSDTWDVWKMTAAKFKLQIKSEKICIDGKVKKKQFYVEITKKNSKFKILAQYSGDEKSYINITNSIRNAIATQQGVGIADVRFLGWEWICEDSGPCKVNKTEHKCFAPANATCGNYIVEGNEECDGYSVPDSNCSDAKAPKYKCEAGNINMGSELVKNKGVCNNNKCTCEYSYGQPKCMKACGAIAESQLDCRVGRFNKNNCSCSECLTDNDCSSSLYPSEKCLDSKYLVTQLKCINLKCKEVDSSEDCSKGSRSGLCKGPKSYNKLCTCDKLTRSTNKFIFGCVCNDSPAICIKDADKKNTEPKCGAECNEGFKKTIYRDWERGLCKISKVYKDTEECQSENCKLKKLNGGKCGDGQINRWRENGKDYGEECDPGLHCKDNTACTTEGSICSDGSLCQVRTYNYCNANCLLDCGRGSNFIDKKIIQWMDYKDKNGKLIKGWSTLASEALDQKPVPDYSFFCGVASNNKLPSKFTVTWKPNESSDWLTDTLNYNEFRQFLNFMFFAKVSWQCGDNQNCYDNKCEASFDAGCLVNNGYAYKKSGSDWSDFINKYNLKCTDIDYGGLEKECSNLCSGDRLAHVVYNNNTWTWSCGAEQCKVLQMGCGSLHPAASLYHDDFNNQNYGELGFYYYLPTQACLSGGKPVLYQQTNSLQDPGFYGYNGLNDSNNNRGRWLWRCEYTNKDGSVETAPRPTGDENSYDRPITKQDNLNWCFATEKGECLSDSLIWDDMKGAAQPLGNGIWPGHTSELTLQEFQSIINQSSHFGNNNLCKNGIARLVGLKGLNNNIFQLSSIPNTVKVDPSQTFGQWLNPFNQGELWDHTGYAYYSSDTNNVYWICDRIFDENGMHSSPADSFPYPDRAEICYAKIVPLSNNYILPVCLNDYGQTCSRPNDSWNTPSNNILYNNCSMADFLNKIQSARRLLQINYNNVGYYPSNLSNIDYELSQRVTYRPVYNQNGVAIDYIIYYYLSENFCGLMPAYHQANSLNLGLGN